MQVFLIRHGKTQGNLEGRYVGATDEPLCPRGAEELLGRRYPPVERLYVSPMRRCIQSARIAYPSLTPIPLGGLRESDFGPFEGKNHEELKDDPLYQAWIGQSEGHLNFAAMPVGESAQQVVDRVSIGLEKLAADAMAHGYGRVGVVSHGGALMGLLNKYGRPEREYYGWMCPNCGGFRMALNPDTLELTVLEEYKG